MQPDDRKYILGIGIDDIGLEEALERCLSFLRAGKQAVVITPNPEICSYGFSRKWYRRALEDADLSIPDGFGLRLGGAIIGQPITHRTPGADLVQRLLHEAEQKKYAVLFIGYIGGVPGNGERLLQRLRADYPHLAAHHIDGGTFSDDGESDDRELLHRINAIAPDIVIAGIGHPRQELFLLRNRRRMAASLLLAAGGTADYLAGAAVRAPQWMRSAGLEWLYRLIREPRRLSRICTALFAFPWNCFRWKWGTWFVYRKNVAAVVLNERDEVLVCRSALYGYWQIPQGGVHEGEDLEEALLRELKEEIGTDAVRTIGCKVNAYRYRWPRQSRNFHKYKNRGQVQTIFLVRYLGADADIRLDKREFDEFTWVPKDAIVSSPLIPEYKKPIITIGLSLLTP